MLYLAWDREINISLFFCDVFVWKWGPRPRTSSRCYHGNKSAATFKKGIFVHPPWVPNCMQNLKGGWKFSFPKMFDSYRDSFLTKPLHRGFVQFSNFVLFHNQSHGKDSLDWNLFKYIFWSVFKTLLLWSVFFNSRKMMWVDFIRHEKKINELKRWTDKWVVLRKQTTEIKRWLYSP